MLARLFSYYRRINARHRAYLPVVPICMLVATAWTVYRQSQEPVQYASTGRIVVSGRMNLPEANSFSEELNNFLGTQQEILQSEDLAARARQQVLLERPELTGAASVRVTLLRGTSILLTQAVGTSPEFTTRFLDALLEQFIESRRDRRMETTLAAMRQIRDELPRVERQLAAQEDELFRFKERHNMGFWGRQSAESAQLLSQLKLREANLRMQLDLAEALESGAAGHDRETRLTGLASLDAAGSQLVKTDNRNVEQIAGIRAELIRLQVEREQQLAVFKPRHPRMVRLEQEISRQTRLLELLAQESNLSYKQRLAGMRSELASIQQAIEEWEKKTLESTRTEAEYEKLQTGLTRTRDLYARLLNGLQSIDVGRGVNVDIVQILQRATPAQPIAQSLADAARRGLGFGAVAGILLLLGLARIDQRAYSTAEILTATRSEAAIEVPYVPKLAKAGATASGESMPPELREAMRHLTASLGISGHAPDLAQVVLCVSSSPGEGKSTLSLHLALHGASAGLRTLLIDGDLRRGHLAETIGRNPEHIGYGEIIEGKLTNWREAVQELPDPRLHFISRGGIGSRTVDQLSHWLTAEQLADLRRSYQLIVIDAAPLMPVADSQRYLKLVDHVLLITRLRASSQPLIERTAKLIRQSRQHPPQLVINGVRHPQGGYGYGYDYEGYGYQGTDAD